MLQTCQVHPVHVTFGMQARVGNTFNAAENFWWCDLYSALLKEVS